VEGGVGDDQHQVGHGLGEPDADDLGVQQAEGEDEVLAGDAVGVPEQLTGVHDGPQAQPGVSGAVRLSRARPLSSRGSSGCSSRALETCGQSSTRTPSPSPYSGLLDVLWGDLRRGHGVAEEQPVAQSRPGP
jgi:hypothetical protein